MIPTFVLLLINFDFFLMILFIRHAHTSSGTVGMKSVLADKVSGISDDNVRSDDALKSIFQRLESSEKSQAVAGGLLTSTGGRVSSTGAGADNLSDAEVGYFTTLFIMLFI